MDDSRRQASDFDRSRPDDRYSREPAPLSRHVPEDRLSDDIHHLTGRVDGHGKWLASLQSYSKETRILRKKQTIDINGVGDGLKCLTHRLDALFDQVHKLQDGQARLKGSVRHRLTELRTQALTRHDANVYFDEARASCASHTAIIARLEARIVALENCAVAAVSVPTPAASKETVCSAEPTAKRRRRAVRPPVRYG
jgi:hypothetical protein